jgi:Ribbon-helix-helix protein, copG family
MTPVGPVLTFRVEEDVLAAMERLKDRDGIPYSEQIRRALRFWLAEKDVMKSERKRGATRKRP